MAYKKVTVILKLHGHINFVANCKLLQPRKKIHGVQDDMKCPQQFMVILNKNENTRAIQMEFLKEKVCIFRKLMEMLVMEVWQA